MKVVKITCLLLILSVPMSVFAARPDNQTLATATSSTLSVDNTTFIDANEILMCVSNYGTFGRDIGLIFNDDLGTFYPYEGDTALISENVDGLRNLSVLYQAGVWLAGIDSATGEVRAATAEYGTEYVPGPMQNGTYMTDNPDFRVYKLYYDSLESAPNDDYYDWPLNQGAPVENSGNLRMYGRQMLWTVYNDADPNAHDLTSTEPLGIEIQQTVWAGDELGDDTIYYNRVLPVEQIGSTDFRVYAWVADPGALLEGNDYIITFEDTVITDTIENPVEGTIIDTIFDFAWHLDNITTGHRLVSWQRLDESSAEVEGVRARVRVYNYPYMGLGAPADTFAFTAVTPPYYISTLEGSSIYIKYKLYNKGGRTINDMYFGFWSDPDLGGASDDFFGCDTLGNMCFCYNADDTDWAYGTNPPAIGFKYLYGPAVPSAGDTAFFDGSVIQDFANLGMTALIGFCDPDLSDRDPMGIYTAFQGYDRYGNLREYDGSLLPYWYSGDPVTGTGDLETYPCDKKMMASSGPFNMRPGDSQFVLIKMAVAQGADRLDAITQMKAILNQPYDPLVDTVSGTAPGLPRAYYVKQNYPNPFNPSTTIEYALSQGSRVTIDIYNILGQKVRTLLDTYRPRGVHQVTWDGTDRGGNRVASGLYFYRVTTGDFQESRKMILLK